MSIMPRMEAVLPPTEGFYKTGQPLARSRGDSAPDGCSDSAAWLIRQQMMVSNQCGSRGRTGEKQSTSQHCQETGHRAHYPSVPRCSKGARVSPWSEISSYWIEYLSSRKLLPENWMRFLRRSQRCAMKTSGSVPRCWLGYLVFLSGGYNCRGGAGGCASD